MRNFLYIVIYCSRAIIAHKNEHAKKKQLESNSKVRVDVVPPC